MFHECRHIKSNGERCHAAALSAKPYCYFHMNLRRMHSPRLADSQHFQLPPIEDNASVLLALGQVIKTLNSPYSDTRRAGLMLYALQIAAQLTNRKEQAKPSQSVRNLYSPSEDELDFSSAIDNGIEMLAPDTTVCEPPEDCRNCPRKNTCLNQEPQEHDADEKNSEDNSHNDVNQQQHNADDDDCESKKRTSRVFLPQRCHPEERSDEGSVVVFQELNRSRDRK
jgi:hypothetical protein